MSFSTRFGVVSSVHLGAIKCLVVALGIMVVDGSSQAQERAVWKLKVTPEQTQEAVQRGEADGAKSGGPFTIPKRKKIGVILLSAQSDSTRRILDPVQELAKLFNYEVIVCDPNFDAQKIAQCATSMVAQNASAVFSISTSPGPLGSALSDASERGIPWFATLSAAEPTPDFIQYGNTGVASAQLSANWLFKEAAARKGPEAALKFTLLTAPTVGLANLVEEQEVIKTAKQNARVAIVTKHDLDLANIVQDTLSTTTQSIQQHPDLAGIWTVCDLCVALVSQAVTSAGLPDNTRPIIAGDFTTPQSVALMRQGKVDMLMDLPFEASVWVAFDQLLGLWSQKKKINPNFDVFSTGYSLKFMEPYLLTKKNIGESGAIPIYGPDYKSYFQSKWKHEFGLK